MIRPSASLVIPSPALRHLHAHEGLRACVNSCLKPLRATASYFVRTHPSALTLTHPPTHPRVQVIENGSEIIATMCLTYSTLITKPNT